MMLDLSPYLYDGKPAFLEASFDRPEVSLAIDGRMPGLSETGDIEMRSCESTRNASARALARSSDLGSGQKSFHDPERERRVRERKSRQICEAEIEETTGRQSVEKLGWQGIANPGFADVDSCDLGCRTIRVTRLALRPLLVRIPVRDRSRRSPFRPVLRSRRPHAPALAQLPQFEGCTLGISGT
jgi:hypothetical protein